jgi:ribosomal protein S18 acetylase RimI-like enzyme
MKNVSEYHAQDFLADDKHIAIRAISPEDKATLQEGMKKLSDNSRYNRFLIFKESLTIDELVYFTELDFVKHVALMAVLQTSSGPLPVGVGRYIKTAEFHDKAELAITILDDYQRMGIATALLKHLTIIARPDGVRKFVAFVAVDNTKAIAAISKLNESVSSVFDNAAYRWDLEWDIG